MNLKAIARVITVFVFMAMLPVTIYAQEIESTTECESGEFNSYLFEDLVSDIEVAYEAAEKVAIPVRRAKAILDGLRSERTDAFENYAEMLDLITEANQTYSRVMGELSAIVVAAGGQVLTLPAKSVGFNTEIPPEVQFEGSNFDAQNNRLLLMRQYIQNLNQSMDEFGQDFEYFSNEIIQLEEVEMAALEDFMHSMDLVERQRSALSLYLRLCGDQTERVVEDALISGEPDISAPEFDANSPDADSGTLGADPYWRALVDGNADALAEILENEAARHDYDNDDAEVGNEFDSLSGEALSPEPLPGNPETANDGSEADESDEVSEVFEDFPPSDEDDYGIPGMDGPLLPSDASVDSDNIALPNLAVPPGALIPVIAFPGLPEADLSDAISPEALALLEAINTSGVDISSLVPKTDACGWDTNLICSRFPSLSEADLSNCLASLTEAKTMCTNHLQRKGSALTVARCQADCQSVASGARAGILLYQLAQNSVRAVALVQLQNQRNLEAKHERTQTRLTALRNEVQSHQLHIYVHAETGEMTIHDGPYFDPQPPLVYSGSSQRPATFEQTITLAELTEKLQQLEQEIRDIREQLANDNTWKNAALTHWDTIFYRGSDSCTTVSDVDRSLAQCRADCAAQGEPNEAIGHFGPISQGFCWQSTNMLGAMMYPEFERWLSNN